MTLLDLCPGMRLGGQQLHRRLHGGEGRQVFAAVDLSDSRQTVVKIVALDSPADAARLEREFAVLRQAGGPGVAEALGHAVALPQRVAWLVLAAQGPSLASLLAAVPEQRLSTDVALAAAHAAASSLGELHWRGWRHGDLKPGNLLCNADGSVLLSDLEFATRLADGSGQVAAPPLAGTPPFVAPELWREGSTPSKASDVWALGVTLYLCLVGDYPFGREGDLAIAEAIERGPPPHLAGLPDALRKLLSALLARDPAERPADGREAARLIALAAEQLGVDLGASRRALGLLAAALPEGESPSKPGTFASPPSPGTVVRPPAGVPAAPPPDPPTDLPTVPAPGQAARGAAPTSSRPDAGAAEPRPYRPEGIGASSDSGPLWRRYEFLDVSSRAALPQAQPEPRATPSPPSMKPPSTTRIAQFPPVAPAETSPAPAAAPKTSSSAQAPLKRRAAARWFRRMNPDRNFPLSVVFSGKQIRIVGGSGLGITLGEREIVVDPADPVLSVEPWFAGCLISPPRAEVHVSQETTVCRFWVTPLVCGNLPEACVTIRYRGKVVETLATPAKVVKRTLAKVLAALGLAAPLASKALDLAGWNPERLLRQSLPYAAEVLAGMNPLRSGLFLAGLLLAAALFYFYVTRPLLSETPEPHLLPAQA